MIQKMVSFFKNNWYARSLANNIRFSLHPNFSSEEDKNKFFWISFYSFLLFLVTYTTINLIIGAFHLSYLQKYESAIKQVYQAKQLSSFLYYINVYPTNVLLLSLLFFILQFYIAATARSVLWFLGEKNRSYSLLLGIACNSSIYLILGIFGILIVSNLGPASWQTQPLLKTFFIGIEAMFLFAGILFSSLGFFHMTKRIFQLNWGKALLLWVSPIFYILLFFLIFLNE